MEHDERYAVFVFVAIAVLSVGAVMFLFVNAKSAHPKQVINPFFLTGGAVRHTCSDSDFGSNPYVRGITVTAIGQAIDRCTQVGVLEYVCSIDGQISEFVIPCVYGCSDGVCARTSPTGFFLK